MSLDFAPVFARYEALAAEADALFARVADVCPGMLPCAPGCGDCCHALFDLTFVEALYLNDRFRKAFPAGPGREAVLDRANRADRALCKRKRQAFREDARGVDTAVILEELARERVRCPLLDAEDRCLLYAARPITCRLYGAPLLIGGAARTCGRTGFEPGGAYPTVRIENIQDRLLALSRELVAGLPTRLSAMGEVLVPVSMALLTDYDEDYLGIVSEATRAAGEDCRGAATWVLPGPGDEA